MKEQRADRRNYHIIYKTVCLITNKYYIGMHSTDDLYDGYIGSGQILWRSIRKYGKENHEREILELLPDRASLSSREEEILTEELRNDPLCMNIARGGIGNFPGYTILEETRRKISVANKGKKRTDETRKKMSEAGKLRRHSEETRRKISEVQQGRKLTEEWKANIGKACKGKPPSNNRFVFVDGIEYESIALASALTGLKKSTIGKRILSKNYLDTYYKDSPKIIGQPL